ncbi:MAG: septum formation initiator family protein [Candidatus Omnitrophica bacterium]|nr:septum formation initiator family protein [Candidatus Omnitrophota bacterium]
MLKNLRFFIIIFILVALFLPGFAKLQELKSKLADMEDEIRKTQSQNALLEEKIAKMSNQAYLEIVAREKMGVVKKGETVIKIIREGEEMPVAENSTQALP